MKRLNVDGFAVEKFGALQRNNDIFLRKYCETDQINKVKFIYIFLAAFQSNRFSPCALSCAFSMN